jgi:hypothetical protein
MAKIIGILTMFLLLVISPPAVLAYISQDALPGDATYPVKRKLEDGILFAASFHPYTKSLFSVAQSQRRFEESKGLLNKNAPVSDALAELVSQTSIAAEDINNLKDRNQKIIVAKKLADSIEKYNKTLDQQSSKNAQKAQLAQTSMQVSGNNTKKTTTSNPANYTNSNTVSNTVNTPTTSNTTNSRSTGDNGQTNQLNQQLTDQQRQLEETRRALEQIKGQLNKVVTEPVPPAQASEINPSPTPISTPRPASTPVYQAAPVLVPTVSPTPGVAFQNAQQIQQGNPVRQAAPTFEPTPSPTPEPTPPQSSSQNVPPADEEETDFGFPTTP